jgi:hypothetical protein
MKYIYTLFAILTSSLLLAQPTTQPAAPTLAQGDVLSIFSDSYDEPTGAYDFNPNWGQATVCTNESIGGGEVIKMANLNYQGLEYPAADVSAFGKMHIDYFIEGNTTTQLDFYLIKAGGTETAVNLDLATKDSWVSIDVNLTDFTSVDLTAVNQIKVVGNGTVYFDNLYFHGTAPAPIVGETLLDFEVASEASSWTKTGTTSVLEHNTTGGNTGGALKFGSPDAQSATFTYTNASFDYKGATTARIFFDILQSSTTLTGAALHFRHSDPAGAANPKFHGAIHPGINGSSWVTKEFDASLDGSTTTAELMLQFETAMGAVAGAEGVFLLDNVAVALLDANGAILDVVDIDTTNFVVYPNPLRDVLYVKGMLSVDRVSIFDLMGRNVLKATPNKSDFNLDVSNLNKGIYMVDLKSAGKTTTIKVVK